MLSLCQQRWAVVFQPGLYHQLAQLIVVGGVQQAGSEPVFRFQTAAAKKVRVSGEMKAANWANRRFHGFNSGRDRPAARPGDFW